MDYADGNEGVTDPIAAVRKIATGNRINRAQKVAAYTVADAVIVGRSGERYQVVAGLRRAISVLAEKPDGYRRFTVPGVGNLLRCGCPIGSSAQRFLVKGLAFGAHAGRILLK